MSRFLVAFLLVACNGEEEPEPEGESGSLTVATYNAGLAVGFVPGAEARVAPVADAIAGIDADVVCLQEVWLDDQVAAIDTAAAANFEHSYWPDANQSSDALCLDGELDSLLSCADSNCTSDCADEVTDCVQSTCVGSFLTLPTDCLRCVMANVGRDSSELRATCEDDPVEYAYGGSFGTGLLSKHPLENVEETLFESTSNRRHVIKATVKAPDGDVDVLCTHLSAVFKTIPYPRDSGGWEAEQKVQVEMLNTIANDSDTDRLVLLGDLNTGPAGNGLLGEAEDNWNILASEWSAPWFDLDGSCTFCDDNGLRNAISGDNRVIDHVLLQDGLAGDSATRILDQVIDTTQCGEAYPDGALSDHYGVSMTVSWGE